jgi:hypothetical protein
MNAEGQYFTGLGIVICAALGWCLRHSHLEGQSVGPLRRAFRLRRVAPLMCVLTAAGWSVFFWASHWIPGLYKVLVPIMGLIGFTIFAAVWNRRLRGLERDGAGTL